VYPQYTTPLSRADCGDRPCIGVVSMEDLFEAMLGEEIFDEADNRRFMVCARVFRKQLFFRMRAKKGGEMAEVARKRVRERSLNTAASGDLPTSGDLAAAAIAAPGTSAPAAEGLPPRPGNARRGNKGRGSMETPLLGTE
jgi:hypothetical protein